MAEKGIKSHYIAMEDEGGNEIRFKDLKEPVRRMKVKLYRVVEPDYDGSAYDYSKFKSLQSNYLIPLEIIYRFSLPEGSSVFKRLERGDLSPEDLGLKEKPVPGTVLEKPFVDFSTKLDHFDRYLSRAEAREISGLSDEQFQSLIDLCMEAALIIRETYEKFGINNEDGKFEFAVDDNGEIVVVDAVGTPDECRFSKNGLTLSKELARIFYRGTEWQKEVEEAKHIYGKEWRSFVKSRPEKLPPEKLELIANIYRALANTITGRVFFPDAPELDEVLQRLKAGT
jgi:phosphoribosylaminoimidazole-succinocarboxamide synthase